MTFEELIQDLKDYPGDLVSELEDAKASMARLNPSNKSLSAAKELAAKSLLNSERIEVTAVRVSQIVEMFQ